MTRAERQARAAVMKLADEYARSFDWRGLSSVDARKALSRALTRYAAALRTAAKAGK
jgi:fido (protein-threonine AMPylation protein)